jgi:predicted nucleic acid-binding protein
MNNILVDSCFWYALFDSSDKYHSKAQDMKDYLEFGKIMLPFPILYETLNTRFSKRGGWMSVFEEYVKKETTFLIPDTEYREQALSNTFFYSLVQKRPMALVDISIRLMLEDVKLNVNTLITFNAGDFIDVCASNGIVLISDSSY